MQKKRNIIFSYLSALAIIMVIDDHTGARIGFLTGIFPYNSFFMPLFVFISGYFHKRRKILKNIMHKIEKLLIPYLIWSILALVISFCLDFFLKTRWLKIMSIGSFLIKTLLIEPVTSLNGAAWFVIMLFWVSIIYNIIDLKKYDNKIIDIIYTIVFIILGFISVDLCSKGYAQKNAIWLFSLRTVFYIQFYHLGVIFKKYIECILHKYSRLIICATCIVINMIMIFFYGDKINFNSTATMSGFSFWYLPIITSITGIVFYYEIIELVSTKIGYVKIIDFISRNTFVIMQIHLLFINIPNFFVYCSIRNGSLLYNDFNIQAFRSGAWVRYSPNTRLIGFFTGVCGSLLIAYLIEKIKRKKIEQYLLKEKNV